MNRIEINYSFWAIALIYVIPILGLFAYLALAPSEYMHWQVVVILLFVIALGLFMAFRRWTAPKPLIAIDDDGISDNGSGIGLIKWSDIEGAKLTNYPSKKWIALQLKDPKVYADKRAATSLRYRVQNAMLTGDVTIMLNDTDCDPEEIFVVIEKRLEQNDSAARL